MKGYLCSLSFSSFRVMPVYSAIYLYFRYNVSFILAFYVYGKSNAVPRVILRSRDAR